MNLLELRDHLNRLIETSVSEGIPAANVEVAVRVRNSKGKITPRAFGRMEVKWEYDECILEAGLIDCHVNDERDLVRARKIKEAKKEALKKAEDLKQKRAKTREEKKRINEKGRLAKIAAAVKSHETKIKNQKLLNNMANPTRTPSKTETPSLLKDATPPTASPKTQVKKLSKSCSGFQHPHFHNNS